MTSPTFTGLSPASTTTSRVARAASRKRDTRPERVLRKALWKAGLRYRKNVASIPGKPDIVFHGARLAVFVDGDFWHGRDWPQRRARLKRGHNAAYWVAKIKRNMARDRVTDRALHAAGWSALRVWESEVNKGLDEVVARVVAIVRHRPDFMSMGSTRTGGSRATSSE